MVLAMAFEQMEQQQQKLLEKYEREIASKHIQNLFHDFTYHISLCSIKDMSMHPYSSHVATAINPTLKYHGIQFLHRLFTIAVFCTSSNRISVLCDGTLN